MRTNATLNRSSRRFVAAGVVALVLTGAAVGTAALQSGADPAVVRSGPDTVTIPAPPHGDPPPDTATPTTGAPTAPAEDEGPSVPDGRHFGRFRGAYVAPAEVVFDRMELIGGDHEDGAYRTRAIDGPHPLPVHGDVVVTKVVCGDGGCTEGVPAEYGELTRQVEANPNGHAYWVTVRDGSVVRIDEQYLP